VNIREPKNEALGKGLVHFWERFMTWGRWETHERLSICEQLG